MILVITIVDFLISIAPWLQIDNSWCVVWCGGFGHTNNYFIKMYLIKIHIFYLLLSSKFGKNGTKGNKTKFELSCSVCDRQVCLLWKCHAVTLTECGLLQFSLHLRRSPLFALFYFRIVVHFGCISLLKVNTKCTNYGNSIIVKTKM